MAVYLYTLDPPYRHVHTHFDGVEFSNQWITISNGRLTINSQYSWDGCTPKVQPLGLFTIGTPDGSLRFGKPWLYYPSLVHDALCQFRDELPFTKQHVIDIFEEHLQQVEWPLCTLYVAAVKRFGPQDFR
ncbi:hypothetical protein WN093_04545 [Gammaproteobacteria bacterium AS21]